MSAESEAKHDAFHEHSAEALARGFAKPRAGDFEAGWQAGFDYAEALFDAAKREAEIEAKDELLNALDVGDMGQLND